MPPRHVLVVTGARVLRQTPAAAAWARARLTAAIEALPRGGGAYRSVLVTGDAPGPDAWAVEIATALNIRRVVYALDGRRHENGVAGAWWAHAHELAWRDNRRWPLLRNGVMIKECAFLARERGNAVIVCGVRAGWATTQGTAHTLTQARAANLVVSDHLCPPEFAP